MSVSDIKVEIEQVQQTGLDCYKYMFITRAGIEEMNDSRVGHILLAELYEDYLEQIDPSI